MWVAVWLRMMSMRRSTSTSAHAFSPDSDLTLGHLADMHDQAGDRPPHVIHPNLPDRFFVVIVEHSVR